MTPVEKAAARGQKLYRSIGFQKAYVRGARAALDGNPEESCPYHSSAQGWGAWRRAWMLGYRSISE